ncbi:MAG: hypothetical protein LBO00_05335 [Zoogloeaceae bacterium]|nr:hypothetical protein [Zoogloeaceae bacterium]
MAMELVDFFDGGEGGIYTLDGPDAYSRAVPKPGDDFYVMSEDAEMNLFCVRHTLLLLSALAVRPTVENRRPDG